MNRMVDNGRLMKKNIMKDDGRQVKKYMYANNGGGMRNSIFTKCTENYEFNNFIEIFIYKETKIIFELFLFIEFL